jgi:acetyl esterase/lipase
MASSLSISYNPTTKEDVAALSIMDPELKEFLSKDSTPPGDYSNFPALRASRRIQEGTTLATLGPPPSSVLETQRQITLSSGATSEVLLFQPTSPKAPSALVVLIHGGGFCLGTPSQLTAYSRALCSTYGAVVASIGYRLAPEFKCPTQANDVWDGTSWVAEHAESFGADPAKAGFIVGGVSAGGNLAAVTVLRALGTPLKHEITGVWLAIPMLLGSNAKQVPEEYRDLWFSREQNADAPKLNTAGVDAFLAAWEPDFTDEKTSPFARKDPSVKFPRTYVQVCGLDPLRDDALVFERALKKAGTETRIHVYKGLMHGSWAFLPMLNSSKAIVKDTIRVFGWLLGVAEREGDVAAHSSGA